MALRPFGGDQHVPQLSDISTITCGYGLQDIDVFMVERPFGFWQECSSTIDYPTCPGDDHERSIAEFRE